MNILIGTQFYRADADTMRRQADAAASLKALRGVEIVSVQWRDESFPFADVETLAVLEQDCRTVARAPGPRKPILAEVFDALATEARRRGCRWFAFVNSDIVVLQAAIDAMRREQKQTYAFSRRDFRRETGEDAALVTAGLDLFAMEVDWWAAHRRRFRPYILGEWFYDCVFGAILMTFGDGLILNRGGEIRHELHGHGVPNVNSPSAIFNGYLAALDAPLFSLWAHYHAHLVDLRARGASEAEERALVAAGFVWNPSIAATVWHAGRCAKARIRYALARR